MHIPSDGKERNFFDCYVEDKDMHRDNKMVPVNSQSNGMVDPDALQRNAQLQGMGFEIFGEQEFVRYPVIGINQPTSEFSPIGKFHNRVTGEAYDTIEVVFLALRRSMSFRPNGYGSQVPECYSSNSLRPDATVEQPIHHTCHRMGPRGLVAECPNARWTRNSEGKARRACDLRYTAAIDFRGESYLMYFHGSAIAPLEKFLSQLRQFRQPLFGVRVSLGLTYHTKKDGYMGNFYKVNFPDFSEQRDSERIEVIDALKQQESALFFKEYFETAPSDLYHEGDESSDKKEVSESEGVRFAHEDAEISEEPPRGRHAAPQQDRYRDDYPPQDRGGRQERGRERQGRDQGWSGPQSNDF
ncbi:MAG: hypothetical protein CL920_20540 [Deltaproteobacteria bacterium]|nr:hypothetical protein [Deltaproteobacteria bacterium]MBU51082.1 hypothetical protein [Deltaproteobacteria bacterium]